MCRLGVIELYLGTFDLNSTEIHMQSVKLIKLTLSEILMASDSITLSINNLVSDASVSK